MKKYLKAIIISIASVLIASALIALAFYIFNHESAVDNAPIVETEDPIEGLEEGQDKVELQDPEVTMENGEFVFLSGGYESLEDVDDGRQTGRLMAYLGWDSRPAVYFTHDWQLDSYDISGNGEMVIFSTFHTQAKIYRVYRYDVKSETSIILAEFDISDSSLFTKDHAHLPLSKLSLPPDAKNYYITSYNQESDHVTSLDLPYTHLVQSTEGGDVINVDIPDVIYQTYWFTNSEIAFSGADFGGSKYEADYIQLYNINTKQIASTKIPVRGADSGMSPKINPAATAYAYYDTTGNHGYACGGRIMDLTIRSYPDGKILFKLSDVHELEYRWLANNTLEIIYTRIPEVDGKYTPRSQTDQEVLDSIQCMEQEIMYYTAP